MGRLTVCVFLVTVVLVNRLAAQSKPLLTCQSITQVFMDRSRTTFFLFTDLPKEQEVEFVSADYYARSAVPPSEDWQLCSSTKMSPPKTLDEIFPEPGKQLGAQTTCGTISFGGGFTVDAGDQTRHYTVSLNAISSGFWGEAYVRSVVTYTKPNKPGAKCSSEMSYQVTRGTAYHQLTDVHIPGGKAISGIEVFARNDPNGSWSSCGTSPPISGQSVAKYQDCVPVPEIGVGMEATNGYTDERDKSPGITTWCGANGSSVPSSGLGWCRIRLEYKP
jgi:hypothetical protein